MHWFDNFLVAQATFGKLHDHIEQARDLSLLNCIRAARSCFAPRDFDTVLAAAQASRNSFPNDQHAAINLYTKHTPLFSETNKRMREARNNMDACCPLLPYIKLLCRALRELPDQRVDLYRGLAGNLSEADTRQTYAKGCRITFDGFVSTSSHLSEAQVFATDHAIGDVATLIQITKVTSKSVRPFSAFPSESEFLLLPGRCFKVIRQEMRSMVPQCGHCGSQSVCCANCNKFRDLKMLTLVLEEVDSLGASTVLPPPRLPETQPEPQRPIPAAEPAPRAPPQKPAPLRCESEMVGSKNTRFQKHAGLYGKEVTVRDPLTGKTATGVGSNADSALRRANDNLNKVTQADYKDMNTKQMQQYNEQVAAYENDNAQAPPAQAPAAPTSTWSKMMNSGAEQGAKAGLVGAVLGLTQSAYHVFLGKGSDASFGDKLKYIGKQTAKAGFLGCLGGAAGAVADVFLPGVGSIGTGLAMSLGAKGAAKKAGERGVDWQDVKNVVVQTSVGLTAASVAAPFIGTGFVAGITVGATSMAYSHLMGDEKE